jgi:hypothetical protein
VSTSFFARESGLRDAPNTNVDKYDWLEETQKQLLLLSPAFRRFEKRSQKNELIYEAFHAGKGQKRLYRVIFMLFKFPILTSMKVSAQINKKVRTFNK